MKKYTSKFISIILALSLCLSLGVSAFAAEIDTNGGSGTTPVNLSTTADGSLDGQPAAAAMRSSAAMPSLFRTKPGKRPGREPTMRPMMPQ